MGKTIAGHLVQQVAQSRVSLGWIPVQQWGEITSYLWRPSKGHLYAESSLMLQRSLPNTWFLKYLTPPPKIFHYSTNQKRDWNTIYFLASLLEETPTVVRNLKNLKGTQIMLSLHPFFRSTVSYNQGSTDRTCPLSPVERSPIIAPSSLSKGFILLPIMMLLCVLT